MSHRIAIDARKIRDFGIGTYVRNLIRQLAEADSENDYFLLLSPDDLDALPDLPDRFQAVPQRAPVYSVRELFSLSWQLARLKIDLYHATHYVLPFYVPCRAVVTIHDIIHLLYPEYLPNRLAFFYAERMIRHGLHRGDRIITVSHNTRSDLRDYFGIQGRKIEVVHNGIEDDFRRLLSDEERRRRLDALELEDGYVLFVGNPKPHKNLVNVVKAYARARHTQEFDAPLVCVGDREGMWRSVRQRAEQLGIADHIRFVGHVDQNVLPAVYQGARLFVYPTLYEGFGLPVAEAMASGVPVVTSNTSALKEVAAGYAHLVNPLDVDAMAEAIGRCMTDEDHHKSLSTAGLRRSQDFDWRRAAEQTLNVYRMALGAEAKR